MNDSDLATEFDHIDMFWSFDGRWHVRCGTRFQSATGGPDNFHASGPTMVEAVIQLRDVLRADIRRRDIAKHAEV